MLKAYCGLGFLIFLFSVECVAQRFSKDSTTVLFLFGSHLHYGFIIPHAANLTDIAGSNPFGITAEVSLIRHTQKAWSMCNCISHNGVAISYYNFNNPEELGSGINVILFTEPQLTIHKLSQVTLLGR